MARECVALCVLGIFSFWIVGCLGLSVDISFQNELIERIHALEKQGQRQTKTMKAMESRLVVQDQMLTNQAKMITDNKERIKEQDDRLAVQERMIVDKKQKLEEQDRKLAVLEETMGDYTQRLEEQDRKLALQERTIRDYKQRLEEQNRKLALLEQTIGDNKSGLEEQDRKLADQETTISDYKQKMSDLEQTVAESKLKLDSEAVEDYPGSVAEASNGQNPGIFRQNRSALTGNSSGPVWQRRALLNANEPVAFHAVIKPRGEVTHLSNQKIIFQDVNLNLGGGYHSQHGLFIAPRPGIYIFSTTIMSDYKDEPLIGVSLMKNGQIIAKAYAHGDNGYSDQGSVTVVTQLAAGDEVWVLADLPAVAAIWGNGYDSFMGCLVVPLDIQIQ